MDASHKQTANRKLVFSAHNNVEHLSSRGSILLDRVADKPQQDSRHAVDNSSPSCHILSLLVGNASAMLLGIQITCCIGWVGMIQWESLWLNKKGVVKGGQCWYSQPAASTRGESGGSDRGEN